MSSIGARKWWALGAVTLSVLAVGLDGTVLSVALPTLAGAAMLRSPTFSGSPRDISWSSPRLCSRPDFRRSLWPQEGPPAFLALFGVGSAACALSPSSGVFMALGLSRAGRSRLIVMALPF